MLQTQTDWYIDPSNSSRLASDTNDGQSSTTPLLHWATVIERFGGIAPIISRSTVFRFMSDPPDFLDPVVFRPVTIGGASVFIYGGLVPIAGAPSGTFANVVPKNRAAAQLLTVDLGQPVSGFVGNMLQNNTNSARCWVDALGSSGNIAVLTQPLVPLTTTPPTRIPDAVPTEVDIFAQSDAYTIVRPIKVNLLDFRPVLGDSDSAAENNYAFIQQIWIPDPVAIGGSYCQLDAAVIASECRIDRFVVNNVSLEEIGALINTWANGTGLFSGMSCIGGAIATQAPPPYGVSLSGVSLDGDIIIHGRSDTYPSVAYLSIIIGLAYIDGQMRVRQGSVRLTPSSIGGTGGSALWGPGDLNAAVGGSIVFDTSATAQILTTGPLQLDGQTNNGSSYDPTTGLFTGGRQLTVANIDAAPGKALFNPHTGSRYAQYA